MQVSIRIKGHLDVIWQEWLEDLQIVNESDGTSRLWGTLPDQPALYGVLTKINHLSLTLLSLECGDQAHTGSSQSPSAKSKGTDPCLLGEEIEHETERKPS